KMVNSLRILFSNNNKDYIEFIIDNLVVLVILVSSLLITEIVLTRRTATFVFWLYLGKLLHTFDLMKVKLRNKK
ncbi:polymerase, partial [Enterococcus faecium]